MGNLDLPYMCSIKAKGRTYAYYRRHGKHQRIAGELGTADFFADYERIQKMHEAIPAQKGAALGSLDALIAAFYQSAEFQQLKPRTRKDYRSYLEPMRPEYGRAPAASMTSNFVYDWRDKMQATPAKANNAVKTLRRLFSWAVKRGKLPFNPASGVETLKGGSGWKQWPEPALEKCRQEATGPARAAFYLALYTGQRKSDVLTMRWDDIENGAVTVVQEKGGEELQIPLHPLLADELAVMERKGFYIVSRRDGRPLTESGFNAIWRRHKARLALGPVQFHGLRKNATAALYEAGCTPQGVQGITGHKTLQMVQYYGRGARQERLARQAMGKWQKNTD